MVIWDVIFQQNSSAQRHPVSRWFWTKQFGCRLGVECGNQPSHLPPFILSTGQFHTVTVFHPLSLVCVNTTTVWLSPIWPSSSVFVFCVCLNACVCVCVWGGGRRRGLCIPAGIFAMQMNIKKALNWGCIWVILLKKNHPIGTFLWIQNRIMCKGVRLAFSITLWYLLTEQTVALLSADLYWREEKGAAENHCSQLFFVAQRGLLKPCRRCVHTAPQPLT